MALSIPLAAQADGCVVRSGERTAALVELYTSEGCSSCPPADRWLSTLGKRFGHERIVPLALHVDYWDYLGWKDPYAQRQFSLRQRKLSQLQRMALVYTPQVVLQGRDFPAWHGGAFEAAVAAINAQAPKAHITLQINALGNGQFDVAVHAEAFDAAQRSDAALYVAAFHNRLHSRITAGENRGRAVEHDYVVLEWQGPFALGAQGRVDERRKIPLLPNAAPADSGAAAFVQNRRTAEVLQAVMLSACSG